MRKLKVREYLGVVNRGEPLDSLDLNYYRIFNDKIEPVAAVQFHIFIYNWQRLLHFHLQTYLPQFKSQAHFVGRFEQAWSNYFMHFNRGANNTAGDLVESVFFVHSGRANLPPRSPRTPRTQVSLTIVLFFFLLFSAILACSAVHHSYGYNRCSILG